MSELEVRRSVMSELAVPRYESCQDLHLRCKSYMGLQFRYESCQSSRYRDESCQGLQFRYESCLGLQF